MSKLDEVLQMWTADSNIDRTEPRGRCDRTNDEIN